MTYAVYSENLAHCFLTRYKWLTGFLAFLAGMATYVECNPQRVRIVTVHGAWSTDVDPVEFCRAVENGLFK